MGWLWYKCRDNRELDLLQVGIGVESRLSEVRYRDLTVEVEVERVKFEIRECARDEASEFETSR